jgi:N-acetylmuramoyl-L-alanine amidase
MRIIVVQGHRNTSGGNPDEAKRTPAIANAIVAALNAAGHEAVCLQHADGTRDDWFAGSLDGVARDVVKAHRRTPFDLMLDIHLEGDRANTPGVFAIVPFGDGLRTLTSYQGSDNALDGSREVRFAGAIAAGIAQETGLKLRTRGTVAPGIMRETQTHVGGDLGWRLAMFAYTAPVRDRLTRLVIECGNIGADRAVIDAPGFADRVAAGVVRGIARVTGNAGEVAEGPYPTFGTTKSLVAPRTVTVTASRLMARVYAETSQPVRVEFAAGSRFPVRGWIVGEAVDDNPIWWILGDGSTHDPRWRVWSGGTDLAGMAAMALPTV